MTQKLRIYTTIMQEKAPSTNFLAFIPNVLFLSFGDKTVALQSENHKLTGRKPQVCDAKVASL